MPRYPPLKIANPVHRGPIGPRTVTHRIDVRPGDFESINLREPGERPITDVEYEPTLQKVVDAALRPAKVTSKDVVWSLGCGDGRMHPGDGGQEVRLQGVRLRHGRPPSLFEKIPSGCRLRPRLFD
jgi:hypothetical protein